MKCYKILDNILHNRPTAQIRTYHTEEVILHDLNDASKVQVLARQNILKLPQPVDSAIHFPMRHFKEIAKRCVYMHGLIHIMTWVWPWLIVLL